MKTDISFNVADYAPVADRITLFYRTHPLGRIVTSLVSRDAGEITFKAHVFRSSEDNRPAATGWASERVGDGEVNAVACLENTETSAIGRALANLGFTASRQRPSAEEMAKVSRAHVRLTKQRLTANESVSPVWPPPPPAAQSRVSEAASEPYDALQESADAASDLLRLLLVAERLGMRSARVATYRKQPKTEVYHATVLKRVEIRLRRWVVKAAQRNPTAYH